MLFLLTNAMFWPGQLFNASAKPSDGRRYLFHSQESLFWSMDAERKLALKIFRVREAKAIPGQFLGQFFFCPGIQIGKLIKHHWHVVFLFVDQKVFPKLAY